jgi:hypothetical protein
MQDSSAVIPFPQASFSGKVFINPKNKEHEDPVGTEFKL